MKTPVMYTFYKVFVFAGTFSQYDVIFDQKRLIELVKLFLLFQEQKSCSRLFERDYKKRKKKKARK